ncbi:hypothetical protein KP509_18G009000 [Ceratopteris richardii]|nr:hypothetical protein KP509_18G009000 [Ceratopteris richardii]
MVWEETSMLLEESEILELSCMFSDMLLEESEILELSCMFSDSVHGLKQFAESAKVQCLSPDS